MLALSGAFLCTAYYRRVREENADADAEAAHGLGLFGLVWFVLFCFRLVPEGVSDRMRTELYQLVSIPCG